MIAKEVQYILGKPDRITIDKYANKTQGMYHVRVSILFYNDIEIVVELIQRKPRICESIFVIKSRTYNLLNQHYGYPRKCSDEVYEYILFVNKP